MSGYQTATNAQVLACIGTLTNTLKLLRERVSGHSIMPSTASPAELAEINAALAAAVAALAPLTTA